MDALLQFLASPAAVNIGFGLVGYLLGLTTLFVLAIVRDPSILDDGSN